MQCAVSTVQRYSLHVLMAASVCNMAIYIAIGTSLLDNIIPSGYMY